VTDPLITTSYLHEHEKQAATGTEKLPEYNCKLMERGESCKVEIAARQLSGTCRL
jgi:hypothetical protein